jgi:acyl-coenzyme A thioesterase PaaI-like protein
VENEAPTVDYEALAVGLAAAVPMVGHLGLEYLEVGPGSGRVRLPDDEAMRNHVGSQHAAGLFAVAETASGAAFVGAFAERLGEITPLARSAEISYVRIAEGPIEAAAVLADPDEKTAALDRDGRVEFPVEVELTDGDGEVVATATVHWHVRRNEH